MAVVAVVAVAFLLRWYYVVTAMVDHPLRGDATQHYYYAWNLLNHHVFSMATPGAELATPDSYRAPGYPLLVAAWMAIADDFDRWYAGVLLTQCILGALAAGITVLLARFWLPLGWSLFAGLLAAVWPHSVTIAGCLLSETLYGFLMLLGMLLYGSMLKTRMVKVAASAGLCFGLAILVNPVLLPMVVLLPLAALWRGDASRRALLAFAICASSLPVSWEVRTALLPASGLSSRDRAFQNLVHGSWPGFNAAWRESVALEPDRARIMPLGDQDAGMNSGRQKLAPIEREEQAMLRSPKAGLAMLGDRFLASPAVYLKWYLVQKPALLWGWDIQIGQGEIYVYPTENSPFETMPSLRALVSLCHGLNPILGIGALIAAIVAIVRRRLPSVLAGALNSDGAPILCATAWLLAYVTAMHTLLQSEPRYSIPYRPFEVMLAATALAWLVALWRHRRTLQPAANGESGRE